MARRKARVPQGKKIQPAVMTMNFAFAIGESGTEKKFIDLGQCASLLNRRFYRQGLQWQVAGFKVFSNNTTGGGFAIEKVPNTWVASNAWEKGMRNWLRMNNDALESSESIKPRFMDFKVFMDADHHAAGSVNNMLPGQNGVLVPGEWDMSEITFPTSAATGNATDFEVIWTGANFPGAGYSGLDAVSLIQGYASSRGLPDIRDPNAPADADDVGPTATPENWIGALHTEGTTQTEDVLTNLLEDNNQAPYPFENGIDPITGNPFTDTMYPGGAVQGPGLIVHDITSFNVTTVSETNYLKGGLFNGGLICCHAQGMSQGATVQILVDLVPGPHRGYMARSMKDV